MEGIIEKAIKLLCFVEIPVRVVGNAVSHALDMARETAEHTKEKWDDLVK